MVCFCGSVGNRLWIVFVEFEMPRLKGVFDDVISTSFSWSVCHKADRGTPQIRALERQRRKKTGDGMKGGRRGSSFRYLPWITPAFSSTSCTQCTTGPIVWLEAVQEWSVPMNLETMEAFAWIVWWWVHVIWMIWEIITRQISSICFFTWGPVMRQRALPGARKWCGLAIEGIKA